MNTSPFIIEGTNLSDAWCTALERIVNSPAREISPLVITLTEFNESSKIREVLDSYLSNSKLQSIQTVSETIFPKSLNELYSKDRGAFYYAYIKNLPRIRKIDRRNGRGTYFERLIAYNGTNGKINQLEIIISSLQNKNVKRRSKLQASIFDPSQDHSDAMFQGFPCLQHITLYKSDSGGIVLNSFYAIQYLYQRAYGNWLGLINLGKFVASELGLKFERFNCFIGVEQLDQLSKTDAKKILQFKT